MACHMHPLGTVVNSLIAIDHLPRVTSTKLSSLYINDRWLFLHSVIKGLQFLSFDNIWGKLRERDGPQSWPVFVSRACFCGAVWWSLHHFRLRYVFISSFSFLEMQICENLFGKIRFTIIITKKNWKKTIIKGSTSLLSLSLYKYILIIHTRLKIIVTFSQ